MQSPSLTLSTLTSAVLLGLASIIAAHGHDEDTDMNMVVVDIPRPSLLTATNVTMPLTFFDYGEHSGLLATHIILMTFSWVFILPIGVVLSIARSRYTLAVQFLFLVVNAIGVFLITIYNASTPDLYPNNAHHKLGWIVTWVVVAQVVIGVIHAYSGRSKNEIIPMSTRVSHEHLRSNSETRRSESLQISPYSEEDNEPENEGLRSQSMSSQGSERTLHDIELEHGEDDKQGEKQGLIHGTKMDIFLTRKIPGMLSGRMLKILQFFYQVIDRLILILGFITFTTGLITYAGFFMGDQIFSGLAHFIKGGVFFWFGILTLGRWAGCFADIGWAWNNNPKSRAVSAEFMESFLLFFYGSTNIFLEHLASWGQPWSAQDLEHVSITVMFIGGGLCGMLIESQRIRSLLAITQQRPSKGDVDNLAEPQSYRFPMNPVPALIILLLGLMMSSHHQNSMVSTMMHKQWGMLLVGASFARAATYILFYLSPPTSFLPGRPPTELITAFCFMAGGMIFMASSSDTVIAMENLDLDAMFMFNVSIGVITLLMAWIIVVIAIKGLALRREQRSARIYVDDFA